MRSSLGLDGEGSITAPAAVCDSFTAVQTEDQTSKVRVGSISTELGRARHVRFTPDSNRIADIPDWLLRAKDRIGGSLAAPPLPHHRTYGSVYGGSRSYANALRSNDSTRVGWAFGFIRRQERFDVFPSRLPGFTLRRR